MTVLLDDTALDGDVAGEWRALQRVGGRTHVPVAVQVTAGTATVTLEGRNGPGDTPVEITQASATEGIVAAAFPQMRVVVSGAVGASVRVSMGALSIPVS